MPEAVGTPIRTFEIPWEGLGHEVSNKLTPAQLLKAAHLNWPVEKRQLTYFGKEGKPIIYPGKFGLVRGTDDRPLSIVGATYKPVQNEAAMDFFRKFVIAGHMKMEILGQLHGGQYIWMLARIGLDFKLANGDEVRGFLLLCQPHVFGKALVIMFTPIRMVCLNMLTYTLGGRGFRMPHSMEFTEGVRATAEQALGLAKQQMASFKEAAMLLSKKKAKASEVDAFFCDVLKFDPKVAEKKKARTKSEAQEIIEPRMLPKLRMALDKAPGAGLSSAKGTWWGALNAVSFVVDHELGRDQSASLRTAWLGAKAGLKRRAMTLALERAKA